MNQSREANVEVRVEEVKTLDENRLVAQQKYKLYLQRMLLSFQKGDLVLSFQSPVINEKKRKEY